MIKTAITENSILTVRFSDLKTAIDWNIDYEFVNKWFVEIGSWGTFKMLQ